MDQRRFIAFLILSMLVMVLFSILFPPPPPPKPPAGAQANAQKADEGQKADPVGDKDIDLPAEQGEQPQDAAQPAQAAAAPVADVPTQYFTLGSLDPTSGYRMLATVTNQGASVWRAELASPRYRDQDDRSGYIGELELKPADGGLEVHVVGAGTPAAQAGLKVGDVIVAVGDEQANQIRIAEDFENALAKTEPGQQVKLQVRRSDGKAVPIAVKLNRRPFAVVRPEAENYGLRDEKLPPNFQDPASFLMTLVYFNGKQLDDAESKRIADMLRAGNWEAVESNEKSVAFRRVLPDLQLEIIKRYTIDRVPESDVANIDYPGYDIRLEIELRNTANAARSLAYQLDGPTGLPLEGWWYAHKISRERWFGGAGLRDVVVRFDGNAVTQLDGPQIAGGDTEPMGGGEALAFAGVDGQYFAAVMIPEREALGEVWFDTVEAIVAGTPLSPRTPRTYANVTSRLTRRPIEVPSGGTRTDAFKIFLGPKRPSLLANYQAAGDPNHTLKDIVYYGLSLFGFVAQVMLAILHFFHGIVGNYGIAIIMLTVLVRGAMFPISYKQTQNMARMQALKPEMDRISEKYKSDMQKRSQAIQELYRKHNINPLGGCLPLFLQLPIFIGLYRALMVDVELRLSPLFSDAIRWCSNLAAPDMFYNWSWFMPDFITSGQGFLGLGPYFNILPIVTIALFLVTQKMAMPAPTNEQAAMQQKMMKWMTVFMGLLFYKVASGLCLYFIASSLWGIGERKMLPKSQAADSAPPAGAPDAKAARLAAASAAASANTPDDGNGSRAKRRPKAKRKK